MVAEQPGVRATSYPRPAGGVAESVLMGFVMPSTYLSLHYHLVFGTKNREPLIAPS